MPQCSLISGGSRGGARGFAPPYFGKNQAPPPALSSRIGSATVNEHGQPIFYFKIEVLI